MKPRSNPGRKPGASLCTPAAAKGRLAMTRGSLFASARPIRDARKALLAAQHMQHVEDGRRGGAARQRGAQGLGDAAELGAGLFGIGARRGFERGRLRSSSAEKRS